MMMCEMSSALLLIALASGYVVLYLANREEKAMHNIGFFIGVFVMAFSAVIILGNVVGGSRCAKMCGGKGMMMKHGQMMPPIAR